MKDKEIIKILEADGWYFLKQKGSHRQFLHPTKPGKTTVPMHAGRDILAGTLKSILKQAGLK